MKKQDYRAICKKCGQEYGQHRWENDACPREKGVAFHKTNTFEPVADSPRARAQGGGGAA